MKLYSRPLSPYSARVRVALYAKELPFEHVVPEMGWSKDATFLALNPVGRIPVLELASGERLIESSAIVEYLDDAHPAPALRAESAVDRAAERALVQLIEHDVLKPMMDVFVQVDQKQDASAARTKLARGLTHVERLLTPARTHAGAGRVTIVDAILLPVRHSLRSLEQFASAPDLLVPYPSIAAYLDSAMRFAALSKVAGEMDEGLAWFAKWRAAQQNPHP